jgi:hypothetical protein
VTDHSWGDIETEEESKAINGSGTVEEVEPKN